MLKQLKPASLKSLVRNSYLLLFLGFAASILRLKGTVNSISIIDVGVVFLLIMTISGLDVDHYFLYLATLHVSVHRPVFHQCAVQESNHSIMAPLISIKYLWAIAQNMFWIESTALFKV